ncbi:MFS transporter [Krasilnikovia sp. MM14-A1004]|uniref:MFS transporter n=1 Tax=Krasilnikovia sp. MM14-A1004 TaxID=3373541 RepID=UPI00399CE568
MTGWTGRLARFLPTTSAGRRMALVALVDSCGTGIFLTGSVIFLSRVAGLSAGQIGVGLSVAGIVGFASTVPIGVAADRIGARRMLVMLQVWRGAWFVAYAFVAAFPVYVVVACMLALAEKATGPLNQAVVGAAVGTDDRVRTMATIRVVRNVGFSLGALAGTMIVGLGSDTGFRGIILANAASFFLAAFLLRRIPLVEPATAARRGGLWRGLASLRDGRYLALTGLNAILVIHMTMLSVGIPLLIVTRTPAPPQLAGVTVLVNTLLVILFQVRASRGCDDLTVAAHRMRWSGVALAASCLLLGLTAGAGVIVATVLVVAAVVLLAAGEMWQSAGSWGVSYELAPAERRAEYLSVFSLGSTAQSVVGPALLTTVVVPHGTLGWLGLGVLLLGTGLALPVVVARASRPVESHEWSPR